MQKSEPKFQGSARRQAASGCLEITKEKDIFGQRFQMTIDGDIQVAKSHLGSICSIMICALTLLYAY